MQRSSTVNWLHEPAMRHARAARRARAGFTLLELIVVVVLLGVVAGVAAPRLMRGGAREMRREVSDVAAVLSLAAQRDATGMGPIAIDFNDREQRLALLSLRSTADARGRLSEPRWSLDRLAPEASLERLRLSRVLLDGSVVRSASWWFELPRWEPRPALSLLLVPRADDSAELGWWVTIASSDTSAVIDGPGFELRRGPVLTPIDLDAEGRSEVAW